ncbi:MAG: hypothetical protein JO100_00100 [Pseudonocardia sp.]|nr:hypothetical protein [Pseudonocardia sp.]
MSVAEDRYPELHRLIDRLSATQADELRRHALRLLTSTEEHRPHRLSFTGIGTSPNPHLGAEAKQIIRTELRGTGT